MVEVGVPRRQVRVATLFRIKIIVATAKHVHGRDTGNDNENDPEHVIHKYPSGNDEMGTTMAIIMITMLVNMLRTIAAIMMLTMITEMAYDPYDYHNSDDYGDMIMTTCDDGDDDDGGRDDGCEEGGDADIDARYGDDDAGCDPKRNKTQPRPMHGLCHTSQYAQQ